MSKPVCYMGTYNEHDIRDMHTVVVRYVTDFKSNPDRVMPLYDHPPGPTGRRVPEDFEAELAVYLESGAPESMQDVSVNDLVTALKYYEALSAAPAPTKEMK